MQLVDLKAELFKKQEEARRLRRATDQDGGGGGGAERSRAVSEKVRGEGCGGSTGWRVLLVVWVATGRERVEVCCEGLLGGWLVWEWY